MRKSGVAGVVGLSAVASLFVIAFAVSSAQQKATPPPEAKSQPLPKEGAAESYAIYSELLPGGEIEWGKVPRSFWLMEGTTKAEPPDSPCATGGMMNPHKAIQAPQDRQAEFAEVLADFGARCHERYQLDASQFHVNLPVHLLSEEDRKRYVSHVSGFMPPMNNIMQAPPTPDEFKGAAGMHSFTAVYFNKAHTLAMTEIGMYCGGLCGNWSWVVLEHRNGRWQVLPWVRMRMMS